MKAEILTGKQDKFCQNIVSGMIQVDAYLDAYPDFKGKRSTADTKASVMRKMDKIGERIDQLQVPLIRKLERKQDTLINWAEKLATGDLKGKKEIRKALRSNPTVLNNLINKLLPTKSESKTEAHVSGIEAILKTAKEHDND